MDKLKEAARVLFYLGVSTVLAGLAAYLIIWIIGPFLAGFAELATA